jgi:hypothetical protein
MGSGGYIAEDSTVSYDLAILLIATLFILKKMFTKYYININWKLNIKF